MCEMKTSISVDGMEMESRWGERRKEWRSEGYEG